MHITTSNEPRHVAQQYRKKKLSSEKWQTHNTHIKKISRTWALEDPREDLCISLNYKIYTQIRYTKDHRPLTSSWCGRFFFLLPYLILLLFKLPRVFYFLLDGALEKLAVHGVLYTTHTIHPDPGSYDSWSSWACLAQPEDQSLSWFRVYVHSICIIHGSISASSFFFRQQSSLNNTTIRWRSDNNSIIPQVDWIWVFFCMCYLVWFGLDLYDVQRTINPLSQLSFFLPS